MGYESNVDQFRKNLKDKEYKFLEAVGQIVKSAAKLLCPVGLFYGGSLRNDIKHKVISENKSVAIGNDLDYALYVNKGTGIHAEDGNGRKTPWQYYDPKTGEYHFTHGQKPQPYLQQALDQQHVNIKSLAEKIIGEVNNG